MEFDLSSFLNGYNPANRRRQQNFGFPPHMDPFGTGMNRFGGNVFRNIGFLPVDVLIEVPQVVHIHQPPQARPQIPTLSDEVEAQQHNAASNHKPHKKELFQYVDDDESSPHRDVEMYRELGNREFRIGNYQRAIDLYKICLSIDSNPAHYSNIAICQQMQKNYDEALDSISRALIHDKHNVKFNRVKGVIIAKKAREVEDIDMFGEALDIFQNILETSREDIDFSNYATQKKVVYLFKEEKNIFRYSRFEENTLKYFKDKTEQEEFFSKYIKPAVKDHSEPAYLMCPISMSLMKEPVQIESGVSFDREMLENYWKSDICANGLRDPVTNSPLQPNPFYSRNKALEETIKSFLRKHPWAYETDSISGKNWRDFHLKI